MTAGVAESTLLDNKKAKIHTLYASKFAAVSGWNEIRRVPGQGPTADFKAGACCANEQWIEEEGTVRSLHYEAPN